MNSTEMRARVSRGARLMDAECPGWHNRIDVDALNLASCTECVLGQEFGRFSIGMEQMPIWMGSDYGFALAPKELGTAVEVRRDWNLLTEYWLEEIHLRLLTEELDAAVTMGLPTHEELAPLA